MTNIDNPGPSQFGEDFQGFPSDLVAGNALVSAAEKQFGSLQEVNRRWDRLIAAGRLRPCERKIVRMS